MKRYRCCGCGMIFTGWGTKEVCQICGCKSELIEESKKIIKKEEQSDD